MPDNDLGADFLLRLRSDLLIIGDSILTDRRHASNGNYDPTDPQNQIGRAIPSFSLSGWLRHGMERVVREHGATACHPGEANANFREDDVYTHDLDAGYHSKGDYLDDDDGKGCVVLDLFGGSTIRVRLRKSADGSDIFANHRGESPIERKRMLIDVAMVH